LRFFMIFRLLIKKKKMEGKKNNYMIYVLCA
jgi:hypothetical protein